MALVVVVQKSTINFAVPFLMILTMLGLAVDYSVLQLRRTKEERAQRQVSRRKRRRIREVGGAGSSYGRVDRGRSLRRSSGDQGALLRRRGDGDRARGCHPARGVNDVAAIRSN